MTTLSKYIVLIFLFGYGFSAIAQTKAKDRMERANKLLNSYIDIAEFRNGISEESLQQFSKLFEDEALITFDFPFKQSARQNTEIKRISKDDRITPGIVSVYGKQVPVRRYIELLRTESGSEAFDIAELNLNTEFTGKYDSSKIEKDTVIFEISKTYIESKLTEATSEKYLVCIRFIDDSPIIYSIRSNDEKTDEVDVLLTFVDLSVRKNDTAYLLPGITADITIHFDERINNRRISGTTGNNGRLRFPNVASRRSSVFLDTIQSANGIRYALPGEWKVDGRKIIEQPPDGFVIGLRPYLWNGLAYSVFLSLGGFMPAEWDQSNFTEDSEFSGQPGLKGGVEFNLSYFFNHSDLKYNRNKWLFGLGTGIGFYYHQFETRSDQFAQNWYPFTDSEDDNCEVQFSGKRFSEESDLLTATIPIFFELRKRSGRKFSFSMKAGANISTPLSGSYEANGSFSRWGKYADFNNQVITDDRPLNYFTDSIITYSGDVEYNIFLAEGFFKFSGFFHLFKKNPENALEIGLVVAAPFTTSSSYAYSESGNRSYNGYWISTENNEYRSLAYASDRVYQYYVGFTIGFNFVKYRPR